MNKKLIAAAVSAAIVAPVAAYGEVTLYGRINNAIDINDIAVNDDPDTPGFDESDSSTDVSSVSSRFGIKYNKEIGNGLTAHGRYEFATTTDKEEPGINDIRIATVGLSGPFGRIDVGNQWSSYFNTFGTLVSPTYSLGYYLYSSVGGAPFRTSNTIKYSNSFGPIYAELDVRVNDDGNEGSGVAEKLRGDGVGLGLSWAISDSFTIAAAWDSEEREDANDSPLNNRSFVLSADGTAGDGALATGEFEGEDEIGHDEERIGVAIKGNFGGYWLSVGWQNYELDDVRDVPVTGSIDANDDGDATDTGEADVSTLGFVIKANDDIDTFFIYGGGNFSEKTNWLLGYSEADDGIQVRSDSTGVAVSNDDSEQFTWGVYHNLGGGLKIYYEAVDLDSDNKEWDGSRHYIGMRVDF